MFTPHENLSFVEIVKPMCSTCKVGVGLVGRGRMRRRRDRQRFGRDNGDDSVSPFAWVVYFQPQGQPNLVVDAAHFSAVSHIM